MSFMFPKDVELPPEPMGWTTTTTSMSCGKCLHPLHWKACSISSSLTGPCSCRNDVATYDPDPLDVTTEAMSGPYPRPPKWSPPLWPMPSDFDAMSEREFQAFVIRIGMDANIRHALKGHRWLLLLALGVGAALGFVAGWVAR